MPNNWGGARANAGRKHNPYRTYKKALQLFEKAEQESNGKFKTPLEFLLEQMNNATNHLDVRIDCAKAAVPFMHARLATYHLRSEEEQKLVIEFIDFRTTKPTTVTATSTSSLPQLIIENDAEAAD